MSLRKKSEALLEYLRELPPFIIALSGGMDSTFLAAAAKMTERTDFEAITVQSPYSINREIEAAREFCHNNDIPHAILSIPFPSEIRDNPVNRCYLCKKNILKTIVKHIEKTKITAICDGSNPDDNKDYRPGKKALEEFGIISPLLETGIAKNEALEIAKMWNLKIPIRDGNSCLMTRFPHNGTITEEMLHRVQEGEEYLQDLGFRNVRVRHQDALARIQFILNDNSFGLLKGKRMEILTQFKELGYKTICVDLEGYTMGSFNQGENGK